MLKKLSGKWLNKSNTNPIIFNTVNGTIFFGVGDIIQQKLNIAGNLSNKNFQNLEDEENKSFESNPINYTKLGKMVSWGILSAPMFHIWYTKCLPFFVPSTKNPSNGQVMSKIILDFALASTS